MEHSTSSSSFSQPDTGTAPATTTAAQPKCSKKLRRIQPLNERVQEAYNDLSDLAKKESWETKARFPPNLREPLFKCAKIALETPSTGYMIEDHFFQHLQVILPYNKFTLKKLIYKNILPAWTRELEVHLDCMIAMFITRVETDRSAMGLNAAWQLKYGNDINRPRPLFVWTQGLRLLLWEIVEKFMELRAAAKELYTFDPTSPAHESEEKTKDEAFAK
ncbi:hypothetical protein BGZ65_007569, partial [Modicella reniformis]